MTIAAKQPPSDRFAFGENWLSFVDTVGERSIAEAAAGLTRLLPAPAIRGSRFLDLGCGSGLAMLAAARLGAADVEGVDRDAQSVAAARLLLSRHLPEAAWRVRQADLFDLAPQEEGMFDIVYSWGVLHHTGDLSKALRRAASLVAPGGHLAVALYRKTPLCRFWRREKRFYSRAGRATQAAIRALYQAAYCAGLLATGRNPIRYRRDYVSARGMDWAHDVHDWLGGYPYQSVAPVEVVAALTELGFAMTRVIEKPAALGGLFGSHCDEFVALRAQR